MRRASAMSAWRDRPMAEDFAWFREHHAENMERMFAAVGDLYAER